MPFENIGEDDAREVIEAAEKIEEHVLNIIDLPSDDKKNVPRDKVLGA